MRITSNSIIQQPVVNRNTLIQKEAENPVVPKQRRDTYEKQNPSSVVISIIYDEKGAYIDSSKTTQLGMEMLQPTPETEESEKLSRFADEISGEYIKRYMRTKINLANRIREEFGLYSVGGGESVEELFSMYDKQFGTDSKKELDELMQMRKVRRMLSSMVTAMYDAVKDGKSGKDIMEYGDGSFSRADFDYVMGMANSFDYFGSRELTDKSTLVAEDPDVNSDLKDVAIGIFG